ncbi:MAG: hypothetical protein KF768_05310 [Phycisphaeraceae bacterium]|nr:hypothetical protein [Phycisphaeraceae bacterium]
MNSDPKLRPAAIDRVIADLRRLRRSARLMLTVRGVAWIAAGTLAVALLAGVIDFVVRWPRELRVFLWTVTLVAIVVAAWRVLRAAVRFAPSLTEVALRLERSFPGLSGLLAGGVDLADRASADPMARAVVERAATATSGVRVSSILRRRPVYAAVGALAGIMLLFVLIAGVAPRLTAIGAQRVFTPWAKVDWPKRTAVADATGVRVHPMGTALALRAALLKSDRDADQTRVAAVYRVVSGSKAVSPERRVLLTSQNRPVRAGDAESGLLFERLIEPAGLTLPDVQGGASAAGQALTELTLEYWFETADDRTEVARTLLVTPPAVVGAELVVIPPAYASVETDGAGDGPVAVQLGAGNDDRAIAAPALAGSWVSLLVRFNKPVSPRAPSVRLGEDSAWLRAMLGPDVATTVASAKSAVDGEAGVAFSSVEGGRAWSLNLRLDETIRVNVRAVDEHGIETVERSMYVLEALADAPPTATITKPSEDRSVLPTAVVEVEAEGRDDVGLSSIVLERQRARRPAGSAGAAAEPVEDRAQVGAEGGEGPTTKRLVIARTLDLSDLDLHPGDELWLTALAADRFEMDGRRHEAVRSSVRKLRIMSRQELVEQIWAELSSVRRSAIQLDEDQSRAMDQLAQAAASSAEQAARAQAGISERLSRQDQAVSRLQERLNENALTDEGLDRLLNEARSSIRRAGQRSSQAASDAAQAAQAMGEPDGGEEAGVSGASGESGEASSGEPGSRGQRQAEQSKRSAERAQQDVRDELANLVDMLDQGQDTWASRRAIERLLEEQRSLEEQTSRLGESTSGKQSSELTPEERRQLAEAAAEQRSLADRAREVVERMLERQSQLERNDPAAAEGLAQAAERAQREGVTDRLQEAAQQIQQNQTGNAGRQQAAAAEAMEQMLRDLDQSAQNRDAVLRRVLASLIESLRTLVNVQSNELASLITAMGGDGGEFADAAPRLAGGMTRLHRNTLGVLDEASGGPREAQAVGRLIERAARAQQTAVVALSDRPPNSDEAMDQEEASLRALQEALALAMRTDEQAQNREEARAKAELSKAYGRALDRQVTIRDATDPLVGQEPTRRTRNSARLLGQDQEILRQELAEVRRQTEGLRDAKVFDFAHQRLDELMDRAAKVLVEGEATDDVRRRQVSSIRVLRSLIEALDESRKKDDPFRENEQPEGGGGQGSGQGGGLFPPAAELKLLRSLQEEALAQTRSIDESGLAASDPQTVEEIGRLQRELAEQAKSLLERVSGGSGNRLEPGGGGGGGERRGEPPGGVQ